MRQLLAIIPQGKGQDALQVARRNDGRNLLTWRAHDDGAACDVVLVHVPNNRLDPLVAGLQALGDVRFTVDPRGVVPLYPPASEAPDQTMDVTHRSPLEIFVGGLQSIGSWRGFLGYAAAAAVVAWTGLYTNTIYLLTAAMLIAPFAGPAMNLALGTARGDGALVRQSVLRYFSSLLLTIVIAALLSLAWQQDIPTELMTSNSLVSAAAFMLPLTAGAAGALNLCQSERDSLVTAAGPGMLVAASLAPPAAVVGMAATMGRWEMVHAAGFVLLLQLVGINLAGAIVFRLFGMKPQGVRFDRGRKGIRLASYVLSVGGVLGLLAWQAHDAPDLQRSSVSRRIAQEVKVAVEDSGLARLVESDVRFTRADIPGQNALLGLVYVQKAPGTTLPDDEVQAQLTERIVRRIRQQGFDVEPMVDVTVFPAPGPAAPR